MATNSRTTGEIYINNLDEDNETIRNIIAENTAANRQLRAKIRANQRTIEAAARNEGIVLVDEPAEGSDG